MMSTGPNASFTVSAKHSTSASSVQSAQTPSALPTIASDRCRGSRQRLLVSPHEHNPDLVAASA